MPSLPIVIPPNYGLATLRWSVTGRINPVSCTVGFSPVAPLAGPTSMADDIWADLTAAGAPCNAGSMINVYSFLGVDVKVNVGGVFVGGASSAGPVAGTIAGFNSNVINSAVIVRKLTANIGRKYRGRMFVPPLGLDESNLDPVGQIGGAARTAEQLRWDTFLAPNLAGGHPIVLLHTDVALAPTPITALLVAGRVGTQRRRLN